MKLFKKVLPLCLLALALVMAITALTPKAQAATEGSFTYSVFGGKAIITDYTGSATTLTIPSTLGGYAVTSIGRDAFLRCFSLQAITIPASVTSIGDDAFSSCSSLQSITIPDSVTSIGDDAFYYCKSLTGVYISDIAAWCNIAFGNSDSNPVSYAKKLYLNNTLVTELRIPDGVTSIGDYAFWDCDSLQAITIPDSVTSIGYAAFDDCSSLQSITIPDSVTSIGDNAFYSCDRLQSITIPDGVTSIGEWAFGYCDRLQAITIPDSVTSIGYSAFSGCYSLKIVYYGGTQTKWKSIFIGGYNSYLTNATIHYNHIHDYSLILPVVVEPGCTANGYIEYTCMYGETYREVLPALGHSTGADAVVIAPTCLEQGYTRSACSRCGVTITTDYTDALGHDYSGEVVTTVAPTCTEAGYNQVQCIRCDSVRNDRGLDALGHNVVVIQLRDATCTEQGVSKIGTMCDRCQEVFIQPTYTPALGHDYVDGICTRCGEEATEPEVTEPTEPSVPVEPEVTQPTEPALPDGTELSIVDAIAKGLAQEHNVYTTEKYKVTGVIKDVYNATYGNMHIVDENGNSLTIYGTYSADGSTRYDALEVKPVAGDTVTIYGPLGNYNGDPQIKNGWIVAHTAAGGTEPTEPTEPQPTEPAPEGGALTIPEANELGKAQATGAYTTAKYKVSGTILEIDNTTYGNMTITDGTNTFYIYGTYNADGTARYDAMEVKPAVGDEITVYGVVGNYSGNPQMKNGWIVAYTVVVPEETEPVEAADAEISFADKANRTSFSTTQQVWAQNGITVTNDKDQSTTNIADYAAPARFYKNSKLTIEAANMIKIVIKCNNLTYANQLAASLPAGVAYTQDVREITIELAEATDSFSISLTSGQVRVDEIGVYFAEGGSEPEQVKGDLTGDSGINNDDVLLLFWHVLFPEDNAVGGNADLNKDGSVNNDDVLLLLWHVLFPEENPL